MKHIKLYEGYLQSFKESKKEKKDLMWIHKSMNTKKLQTLLGIAPDQNVTLEDINKKIEELQAKRDKERDFEEFTKKDEKLLRRLEMAKNLKS